MKIVCCYWRSTFVEKHWDTIWSLAFLLRPGEELARQTSGKSIRAGVREHVAVRGRHAGWREGSPPSSIHAPAEDAQLRASSCL